MLGGVTAGKMGRNSSNNNSGKVLTKAHSPFSKQCRPTDQHTNRVCFRVSCLPSYCPVVLRYKRYKTHDVMITATHQIGMSDLPYLQRWCPGLSL